MIRSLPPHENLDEFLNRSTPQIDSLSTSRAVLRSTDDPTNSPNADLRSTHDLANQQQMPFESPDDPTTNLGCSDTTCCAQKTTTT